MGSPQSSITQDSDSGLKELTMEVPGFKAEDLEIEIENDRLLRIKGSRQHKVNISSIEKSFDQMFQLDPNTDTENLKVSLADGILYVQAPRKETKTKKLVIDQPVRGIATKTEPSEKLKDRNVEEVDGLTITTDEE